jgi:hypothetical protein
MSRRMPILRQHDVAEIVRKSVDDRDDLIAARHRQRAAGAEIVLYVDHDEDVTVADCVSLGQFLPPWSLLSSATALRQSSTTNAAVNLRCKLDQVVADLNRITRARL